MIANSFFETSFYSFVCTMNVKSKLVYHHSLTLAPHFVLFATTNLSIAYVHICTRSVEFDTLLRVEDTFIESSMQNVGTLRGKTLFITGASRGIGKAIALKAARDGANIVVAAKTADPHPKLPGTIYTSAEEIEKAGGKALACVVDVRDETQVRSAVQQAVQKFGGIDILVNNASAISLTSTLKTDMKRYDLMNGINSRGTFLVSKECLPYILKSNHGHILNISPPLTLNPRWFGSNVAYTIAKYGMSMCVLGMAEEFKAQGVAVNALWPRTTIHTAAIEMLRGAEGAKYSRKPEVMADAAYVILCRDPRTCTGNFFIDEELLTDVGVNDFKHYACYPENAGQLELDGFLPDKYYKSML